MLMKMRMMHHFTPVRVAIFKSQELNGVGKDVDKSNPCLLLVRKEVGIVLVSENKTAKSSNPTSKYRAEENKTTSSQTHLHSHVHGSATHNSEKIQSVSV